MRELRHSKATHRLQCQVTEISLPVLKELAKLVAGTYQKIGLTANKRIGSVDTEQQGRESSKQIVMEENIQRPQSKNLKKEHPVCVISKMGLQSRSLNLKQ